MTLNQLNSLDEQELGLALYVINVLAPPGSPKVEFKPKNLTWFRRGVLEKKFLDIFPMLKPEGHATYSSLLNKLGIQHEIKYEQPSAPISHGVKCECGNEYEVDHSEFGLPLGYNRRCNKCERMWNIPIPSATGSATGSAETSSAISPSTPEPVVTTMDTPKTGSSENVA